ncbi:MULTISPECIES: glutathione transferase GstA [Ramlibacter]|uniref:Glutathione transferase GstA n=1 Tax=Ramlibacter pinisoli TaxID=2682844 RepID=A0A6N8J0I6_9BURK|nr:MULTISPECIES: glutathione transferase GstA [Ramlibacter]MBA2961831.1 glutathione transferase GstA [Ramlibacter sp. CGMCC 1.13660]MVQ31773.1 glutathione transferase GstA [Ramlibacter pinisoli]
MKLYFAPAYCSLAVHIALREAGIAADLVQVDTVAGRTAAGADYRAINPRGYVPMLELDDGSRHTEVAALLQYVGDLAPASGLMPPAGSRERFEVLQWLTFVSSELHKGFSPWLFHKETADSTRQAVRAKLKQRIGDLESRLAGREWLVGDRFTVADAYGFTIMGWAPMVGMGLASWPSVVAWLDRVRARPQVRAALQAEGLLKG